MDIASLLIFLVIVGVAIWVIFYLLPLPPPVRTILAVVVAIVFLLWLLKGFGGLGYVRLGH